MITNKIGIVLATLFLALFVTGCSTMPKYVASAIPELMPEPAMASPEPMPESAPVPDVIAKKKSIRPLLEPDTAGIQERFIGGGDKGYDMERLGGAGKGYVLEPLPAPAKASAPIVDRRVSFPMPKPIQPVPALGAPKSVPEARKPVAQLQEGRVAWNTPPTMTMGQSAGVELRVTLDPERFEGLAKRVQSAGATTTETADLSKNLIATLDSTAFDVVPKGPQPQQVLEGRDAIWKWVISPTRPGNHILLLTIISNLEGGLTNEPLTRNIFVNALPPPPPPTLWKRMGNFVLTNWDKLLTLVLIPIGGWLLRAYLKRRKLMGKRGQSI